jgi:hypothetical protein
VYIQYTISTPNDNPFVESIFKVSIFGASHGRSKIFGPIGEVIRGLAYRRCCPVIPVAHHTVWKLRVICNCIIPVGIPSSDGYNPILPRHWRRRRTQSLSQLCRSSICKVDREIVWEMRVTGFNGGTVTPIDLVVLASDLVVGTVSYVELYIEGIGVV